MNDSPTRKLVTCALLTALIFVVTRFLYLPIPGGSGYLNLGDSVIAVGALLLPSPAILFAAGAGSALADLTAGYAAYALPTFLIKAAMGFVIFSMVLRKKFHFYLLGVLVAEAIMVLGYAAFEMNAFSMAHAIAALPFNAAQAGANFALALILYKPVARLATILWGDATFTTPAPTTATGTPDERQPAPNQPTPDQPTPPNQPTPDPQKDE